MAFPNKYKIVGMEILVNFDVVIATRTTYDLLALAGDIGGLKEALGWIGILLVSWYTDLNSRSIMASAMFKQSKSNYRQVRARMHKEEQNLNRQQKINRNLATDFACRE
jgi:hypothetical protein